MVETGLTVAGILRVQTDADVIDHNATKIINTGSHDRIYIWTTAGVLNPTPRLVVALR